MLKKIFRLSRVKRNANEKTIDSPLFKLRLSENGENVSKFAFIISKKIDKSAVVRNKLKRVLAKEIEKILEDIKPGYSFIFIVKKEILGKETDLENIIKDVFLKGNLLK
ncbi:MAG: ribonuclease P protein component [Candidatus Levybacteria bacterium]|nr:ribonuclease P protein component [Candidatus Levybacteria bacterium]